MGYKYSYEGSVEGRDGCITKNWKGSTYAVSEAKARTNLAYQYKQEFGMEPYVKIKLPAKLTKSEMKGMRYR